MYRVVKVLNNNALLAEDTKEHKELIFLGKGVGFQKKIEDEFDELPQAKIYELQKETDKGPGMQIINSVDPLYLEISNEIIALAETKFTSIDENILLPLADHIAFAIERIKNDMDIANPFANDIRLLFPEEFEVAQAGRDIIKERIGYQISDDELGYITLHVHSARSNDKVDKSMLVAVIVNESIKEIEKECNIVIDVRSLSYSRLLMHMKYMLARLDSGEKLNLDMEEYTKTNFPYAYQVARRICQRIEATIHQRVPNIEIGYLALHIERIRSIES